MSVIKVGCRHPAGLILNAKGSITLKGPNGGPRDRHDRPRNPYYVNEVDFDLFNAWMAENKDSELVKSGTVFIIEEPATIEN